MSPHSMEYTSVTVPKSQMEGVPIGAVVVMEVRGRITGAHEDGEENMRVDVEGEATIRPGSINDAGNFALKKLVNDRQPMDFPTGQSELHAP